MLEKLARSIDADDTLMERGGIARGIGLAGYGWSRIRGNDARITSLNNVPRIDHSPLDIPITSTSDRLSFFFHARRRLFSTVQEALVKAYHADPTALNILNTGRPNKLRYAEMTQKQLKKGGVLDHFPEFSFKPKGMSSTQSKADVIRSLNERGFHVEHYDDDPRTQRDLARLFPGNDFYLVNQGLTSLMVSRQELARYPNLQVISYFGENFPER